VQTCPFLKICLPNGDNYIVYFIFRLTTRHKLLHIVVIVLLVFIFTVS